MGSRVRIQLLHILHFMMDFLFPLVKNSKSGVDDRGHRFRSGSPLTNYPHATAIFLIFAALSNSGIKKNISFAL